MEKQRDRRDYLGNRGGNEEDLRTAFSRYVEFRGRSSVKGGRNVTTGFN